MGQEASALIPLVVAFTLAACSSSNGGGNAGAGSGGTGNVSPEAGTSSGGSGGGNAGNGGSGNSSSGGATNGGASPTGGTNGGGATASGGTPSGGGANGAGGGALPDGGNACSGPSTAAAPISLADFESGAIPSSESGATEGFQANDVLQGTIITPGANSTSKAAEFSFASDDAIFFQGDKRPQYLDGSATYDATLGNALEFYMRIPSGSSLLSTSGGLTFSVYTYHWKTGDPWVGSNATGGNLTDSQEHGYGPMRFEPSGADQWLHVVMTTSAFDHSRGNYHFYAAQAVANDQTFFGSLRQFQPVYLADRSAGPTTVDFDEFRLITVPETATICPQYYGATVPASGGDVSEPITITNPTDSARSYRVFVSSVIGLDRQTIEVAMHDADDVAAVDNLQGAVNSDGGLGAAELFAADGSGMATGQSIVKSGKEIAIPAHGSFSGVLVHHVTPGMLGPAQSIQNAGHTYDVRRDTLTTSLIVWDPKEPRISDAAVVFTGSNADQSHPAPPGFPPYADPPAGFHSTDVPPDQAGGYFVSVLKLTP